MLCPRNRALRALQLCTAGMASRRATLLVLTIHVGDVWGSQLRSAYACSRSCVLVLRLELRLRLEHKYSQRYSRLWLRPCGSEGQEIVSTLVAGMVYGNIVGPSPSAWALGLLVRISSESFGSTRHTALALSIRRP